MSSYAQFHCLVSFLTCRSNFNARLKRRVSIACCQDRFLQGVSPSFLWKNFSHGNIHARSFTQIYPRNNISITTTETAIFSYAVISRATLPSEQLTQFLKSIASNLVPVGERTSRPEPFTGLAARCGCGSGTNLMSTGLAEG